MGIAFRFAARSDVGRVRSKNDDSGYAGHYLAVVADGMGGHVGGDVASATAVLDLAALDHSGYDNSAGVYLADEITTANMIMNELVDLNPALAGMGTTCTALLIDGRQIELAHIGDSRAYRLRPDDAEGGGFRQITTDHTFVQRLLEEGRITAAEAEQHPHKNVIMRVLGDVDASPELQTLTLDAEIGEIWVLSSDGLDTVVDVDEIETIMRSSQDLQEITDQLVDLTLDRGAPDNVTVVTVAVIEEDSLSAAITAPQPIITPKEYNDEGEEISDETSESTHRSPWRRHLPHHNKRRTAMRHGKWRGESYSDGVFNMMTETSGLDERPEDPEESSAKVLRNELDERPHLLVGSAATATNTGSIPALTDRTLQRRATLVSTSEHDSDYENTAELPEELQALLNDDHPATTRSPWPVRIFITVLILGLLGAGAATFFSWADKQYYVGTQNNKVTIYNGIPQSAGPFHLYETVEESSVNVSDLPEYSQSIVSSTITARDLDDARRIVNDLENQAKLEKETRQPSQPKTTPPARGKVTTVPPSSSSSPQSPGGDNG